MGSQLKKCQVKSEGKEKVGTRADMFAAKARLHDAVVFLCPGLDRGCVKSIAGEGASTRR